MKNLGLNWMISITQISVLSFTSNVREKTSLEFGTTYGVLTFKCSALAKCLSVCLGPWLEVIIQKLVEIVVFR